VKKAPTAGGAAVCATGNGAAGAKKFPTEGGPTTPVEGNDVGAPGTK